VVEKCEEGSERWEKVPGVVSGTSHTVRDLEPGKKYKFRVKAENMYGPGAPVETDRAVLAKNPFGQFSGVRHYSAPGCGTAKFHHIRARPPDKVRGLCWRPKLKKFN